MATKKTYRYYISRIYLVAVLFYYFLTLPLLGFIWFKQTPELFENRQSYLHNGLQNIKQSTSTAHSTTAPDSLFTDGLKLNPNIIDSIQTDSEANNSILTDNGGPTSKTFNLTLQLILIGGFFFFALNYPFRNYLKKKNKHKPIGEKLTKFVKKYITYIPTLSTAILLLIFTIVHIYMLFVIFNYDFEDEISRKLYVQFFYLSLASSALSSFFVFLWQRHRVNLLYLKLFFKEEELRTRIFKRTGGSIKTRLSIVSIVTVIIPLAIMFMYLYLGISDISDLGELSQDKIDVLIGPYSSMPGIMEALGSTSALSGFYYINALDQIIMFAGIFTGMIVAVIFLFFIVKWNAQYMITPINDLVGKMRQTGRGDLHSYCMVRTNDEIGELAEGYNEMSRRLALYIHNLQALNEANSRFVPTALLNALGKEKITDVKLGDQIQKEMTILFSDIRSFTTLSENHTPKETFDFINEYLGFMEPVISKNNGFIDKYIGDAIMALFNEPIDAHNAALEMHRKLEVFNQGLEKQGTELVKIGIGLNTGKLMLGIVGGAGRISGTVISDAVNLASRLEGLTKRYKVQCIISENSFQLLPPSAQKNCRYIDIVRVKGKMKPVKIFELITDENKDTKRFVQQALTSYESAISLYLNKQFKDAEKIFNNLREAYPEDQIVEIYANRCNNYQLTEIPASWNGVAIINEKH